MTSSQGGTALHAVRAVDQLTAADAVAWFASNTPPSGRVIGYALSARAATWLRVGSDGAVETTGSPGGVLAEAYEMVLFDGERELRWLRSPDGRGTAIAVGENPADLPPGDDVTADPPPRRGDETHTRLLAGRPHPHDRTGWTVLRSERYAAAHLPVPATGGDVLVVETVEYLVEDEHGNVDVADTRTIGLRATTSAAVRVVTAGTGTSADRERTAS
ncbi:CRISPR-associated protein Csx19 [Micromonospora haikouensis]|uniref:type III-D CRISPR-associated protein Csx19 n=1 Tax=Micromonospora haikouensis TaxID=686309 RepID=UPI003699B967